MQFNSYIFLLIYLPILASGYFITNKLNNTFGKIWLTIGCAVFYIYGGWANTIILGLSIALNLLFAWLMTRTDKWKKWLLSTDLLANVALLFYYKYFNFFLSNLNTIFKTDYPSQKILLPLGISFFTFQQIMYIVAVYRTEISRINLSDYLLSILYFPKLIMGPLMEPGALIAQLNDSNLKKVDWDHISHGLKLLSFGLFKKLILADTFAKAVSWGFTNLESATSMDCFLVMLFYTFEIYFDFSGYSDMAIGLGRMFGFHFRENFAHPYGSLTIKEFWRRWHISLSSWFKEYVYIPLGGSRKGKVQTGLNKMIVFFLTGLWHGANWTFVVWGLFHGAFSFFEEFVPSLKKLPSALLHGYTMLIVTVGFVIFRADTLGYGLLFIGKMFTGFECSAASMSLVWQQLTPYFLVMLSAAVIGCAPVCRVLPVFSDTKKHTVQLILYLAAFALLLWCILRLSGGSYNPFIYFRF